MDASVREGRRFTLKGLWDALPMTFFFQVVGCTIDKAEAETLCDEDKRMGKALPAQMSNTPGICAPGCSCRCASSCKNPSGVKWKITFPTQSENT